MGPPLVLLLDIDGTLVGDVAYLCAEWHLHHNVLKSKPLVLRALRSSIVSRLRFGVIRPHVYEFCRAASAGAGRGVEVFVYTASETTWANYLVPCIEAALNTRFNRPILTRHNCLASPYGLRKSVEHVAPVLLRSLRRRYPRLTFESLCDSCVLVDNTPDILVSGAHSSTSTSTSTSSKAAQRLVVCPTYGYAHVYDVTRMVAPEVLHHSISKVARCLERSGILRQDQHSNAHSNAHSTYSAFAARHFRHLAEASEACAASNAVALRDTFFRWLTRRVSAAAAASIASSHRS